MLVWASGAARDRVSNSRDGLRKLPHYRRNVVVYSLIFISQLSTLKDVILLIVCTWGFSHPASEFHRHPNLLLSIGSTCKGLVGAMLQLVLPFSNENPQMRKVCFLFISIRDGLVQGADGELRAEKQRGRRK